MPTQPLATPIALRRAGSADVGVLIDLMREFYAEAGYSVDGQWASSAFTRLIEDPGLGCVWVAWNDKSPIGHAVLTLRYTMEHGASSGYIDDLFVRPEYRRRRIARALLSELIAECRQRDCKAIYVEVGDGNVPAMQLYREMGLERFADGRVLLSSII
jgi:ribosomal protein S18 acetylase RimI-like enzyme